MKGNNGGESEEKKSRRSREDNARCSRGDELCGNSTPEKTGSRRERKCPNIKYARTMQRIRSSIIIYLGS